ncbi:MULTISPECIES: DeoR family transcriptional regulator [Clostridia]|uniref:DeoR family transcriptional regulator n=1 Tax=Clostridia TaxID=186801 RepID=UPI000EA1DF2F|nr:MULTISPECIES: DeoR family transcriptional regulator [Clostridia]NBJ70421.1 DeoR family transcriptional regulator [Roseburia sp. 1XD42-34]RKI76249.1 DeoR family transcriptional regulator [Clostridium sp. 1xD42-85]
MLPLERKARIKELILQKKNLKITDLSKMFGVSEMTIHRDVKILEEEGVIQKTFGGISLVETEEGRQNQCVYCKRSINEKLAYRLILSNHDIEVACCAHCGLLRQQQLGDKVTQAICPDFLRQTTISAPLAWYVTDTSLHMGCCQPQLLTFEFREHAEKFVKGFGGEVYSFEEAKEVLMKQMNGTMQCKHH